MGAIANFDAFIPLWRQLQILILQQHIILTPRRVDGK